MKHLPALLRSSAAGDAVRAALLVLASLGLAACGSVDLVATTNIPTPLVAKAPVTVALHVPKEFAAYIHKEERWSTDWNIALGKAQADGITRLMTAMFENVVMVESVNAGAQLGGEVRAIFEPSVEEYAFVTPRDAGSPFFAVSIKYRVNIYSPDGRLADSWGFTGYGTSPSQGLSSSTPLAQATALALRDAGAKLAVEFRDQAIVRGLLPSTEPATPPASGPTPASVPPAEPLQAPADPLQAPAPAAAPAQGEAPTQPEAPVQPQAPPGTEAPAETEAPQTEPTEEFDPEAKPEAKPPAPAAPSLALIPYRSRGAIGRPDAG